MDEETASETTPPRRPATLRRAMEVHGENTVDEFIALPAAILVRSLLILIPLALALGAVAFAANAGGVLFWVSVVLALALAWPSFIALAGTARLLAGWNRIALLYPDRFVLQHGSRVEEVLWSEVDAVVVLTHSGDEQSIFNYASGHPMRVWVQTETPIANFHREWTELHCRDGRVIRVPSTISLYDDLSSQIQAEVNGRLLPRMRETLEAGGGLTFGPYTLSGTEIRLGNRKLKWAEHGNTFIHQGRVQTINTEGEELGATRATNEVPNIAAMLYLANHFADVAKS